MIEIITLKASDEDGEIHIRPALFINEKLLDYVYVWSCTLKSFDTAYTYVSHLRRFARYLLTRTKQPFTEEGLYEFWSKVTAGDIKGWQRRRFEAHQNDRKKADYDTVRNEARTLVLFMDWLIQQGVALLYEPKHRVVQPKPVDKDDMLAGINTETTEREVIDYSDIEVSDPVVERNEDDDVDEEDLRIFVDDTLPNDRGWLTEDQFAEIISAFSDPVYKAMTYAGFHTGVRNFELMGFPTFNAGRDFVCNPRELRAKLRNGEETMHLRIPKGKGGEPRTIPIETEDWLDIMSLWWPIREERKRQLMDKKGIKLRHDQLWISKSLVPLYCDPNNDTNHKTAKAALCAAFYWISGNKANPNRLAVKHGFSANYYKLRHTFATLWVYEVMRNADEGRGNWDGSYWLAETSLKNDLRKRMGHKILKTTFEHYVEDAVIIHGATSGKQEVWYPGKGYLDHLKNVSAQQKNKV